jgi:hypothetical protein
VTARTYDVLAFRGAAPSGEVRLEQSLFGPDDVGEICTGIQKLAQRFVLEFLTEKGSLPHLANRGCTFMTRLRTGLLRTEADVFIAFSFAMNDVELNLTAEEDGSEPDDERFASANLDRVLIEPGLLTLRVTVRSRAGTSRQPILPIATVP